MWAYIKTRLFLYKFVYAYTFKETEILKTYIQWK